MSGRRDLVRGLAVLSALLAAALLLAVRYGAVDVPLFGGDEEARAILHSVRIPRVLLGALVGATLAAAGVTFQTLLRNPLADPFILGVSGGAACGAAIATALGLHRHAGAIPLVAFAGAAVATALVLAIGRRHGEADPMRLILAGLVLNAFFSAAILLSLSLIRGSDLTAALHWMMGSLANASWAKVGFVGATLAVALAASAALANDLRMLAFGEEDARSRGVNADRVRLAGFVIASLASGAAVAVSGIIGFVGLIVPHAVRLVVRRDYRVLLPLSTVAGAILVVLADLVSRVAVAPAELPIGALTALLGVPFFVILLRRAG